MGNFFLELKRRHIYRVAAAYAVVGWVLLQLFNNLQPILKLPDWAGTLVLVLLLGGLPVALLLAWVHQLAPADGPSAHRPTGRLDWALIGALVIVIGLVSYEQLMKAPSASPGRLASFANSVPGSGGISIAVLPFANLSADAEQEFFSDGMTDEIMSALAKIPSLQVVARTSAFQFKGQNRDIQAISQALHARYVIDGSVRKAGNRVRIAAQLIQADNGVNIWADSFDRELTDVFAIQEDIAQAIAASLRVPLGLKQGESLVPSRAADIDSYQDYLRAKALVRARGPLEPGGPLTQAIKLLEQSVARDANYAPAWAVLAQAYSVVPAFSPSFFNGSVEEIRGDRVQYFPKAEAAAQQAIRLDPTNADAYAALGTVQNFLGKFLRAEDLLKQALVMDPGNPEALQQYSLVLATAGRLKEGLAMRQRLLALEPFVPIFNGITAPLLWVNGQSDAAIAMLTPLPPNNGFRASFLAQIYASTGRYAEAADAVLMMPPAFYRPGDVETAARLLRSAPAKVAAPENLPRLGLLSYVYLYVGASERALEPAEDSIAAGSPSPATIYLWHSSAASLRKTERFKAYIRKAGIIDYWRARGWADLCRPMGADDFSCD